MKPTTTQYRLAAWLRLWREKLAERDEYMQRGFNLDASGLYERARECFLKADAFHDEARGMVDALYCLGFSETEAFEAETEIRLYINGRG